MTDLVLWTGPVANYQVSGATVPGAKEFFLQCEGKANPSKPAMPICPAVGDGLANPKPGVVAGPAQLAEMAGLGSIDNLFMGAFSAGGSVLKRLLERADYRAATKAVMLADATYTGEWLDLASRTPPPIEGFAAYGAEAVLGGDKMLVATASTSPNGSWANGVENLRALRAEIQLRTGKIFEPIDFYGIEPAPAAAYRLGTVVLAEYPMAVLDHGGQAGIAPQVWQRILLPWLAGSPAPPKPPVPPPPGGSDDSWWRWLVLLAAAAAGYTAARLARRPR